jgi:hypothetical protein
MKTKNNKLVFTLRILISALFLLSAIAKLYPIPIYGITKVFEQGQLIPMGFSENIAPYFSRLIIGAEFFLSIAILFNNYLKKIIIPLAFIMIAIFSIHLSTQIFGNSDNCGCFGDLIPMTPMEALIKNIITLLILSFIYIKSEDISGKFSNLVLLFLVITTIMFGSLPISNQTKTLDGNSSSDEFLLYVDDLSFTRSLGPKLLCFFDPDCDHCQYTARSLDSLNQLVDDFPSIHIIFSDIDNLTSVSEEMESRINNFFSIAGSKFSYQTLPQYNYDTDEVDSYMEITFPEYDNPVVILYDGNRQIRLYDGTENNEFNPGDLMKILENE